MKTENENKVGYKKTKLGWIPEDWEVIKLGDYSNIDKKSLKNSTNEDFQFKYISLSDVNNGILNKNLPKLSFKDAPSRARRIVKVNDILLATVRPNLKSFAHIKKINEPTIASTGFAVIASNTKLYSKFLYLNLFSHFLDAQFHSFVVGSNYPAINSSDVKNLKIPLPPLSEQKKIAEILSCWDTAIETTQNLIEKLQLRKKGLMQQLLTGKKRLKGFSGEWDKVRFGKIVQERVEYSKKELPLYSLTIKDGITPKTDRYKRSFLLKTKLNAYKKMYPNDFALNPMNLRFGAIAKHKNNINVNVSKYYNIFYCTESFNSIFFEYYLISNNMIQFYNKMAIGSLEEKKRVHFSDFVKFKKELPTFKEQTAIAQILSKADEEIEQSQQYLETLQLQKKGLMQQLLTGQKRVKLF